MQSSCVDRWRLTGGVTAGVTAEEEEEERCGMTGSEITISKQQQAEKREIYMLGNHM